MVSSFLEIKREKYPFIAITLRSTLIGSTYKGPIYGLDKVSKVADRNRGWPKGSLFNSYYTEM